MNVDLRHGDCIEVMRAMADNSVDAIVTDPPAGIAFMSKAWDDHGGRTGFVGFMTAVMTECLRVLKPGGHAVVWALPRTSHWTATAVEDAGFEIRDVITHIFGSGFPKSMSVSAAIDKKNRGVPQGGPDPTSPHHGQYKTQASEGKRGEGDRGQGFGAGPGQFMKGDVDPATGRRIVGLNPKAAQQTGQSGTVAHGDRGANLYLTEPASDEAREWQGWGTALKPASEHWILARKPLAGTVVDTVLAYGTGAINIDATRVATNDKLGGGAESITTPEQKGNEGWTRPWMEDPAAQAAHAERVRTNVARAEDLGRWPPNLLLSHSDQCQLVGTRKIKGITGTSAGRMAGKQSAVYGDYTGRSERAGEPTGFVDEDGNETVEAWECAEGCPIAGLDAQSGERKAGGVVKGTEPSHTGKNAYGVYGRVPNKPHSDTGGASRFFPSFAADQPPFFYCAKASRAERNAGLGDRPEKPLLWSSGTKNPGSFQAEGTHKAAQNPHPTVKPIALMRWLVRLVTPPGTLVLDPFVGSGSTGVAAVAEGCNFIGIDQDAEYLEIAGARIEHYSQSPVNSQPAPTRQVEPDSDAPPTLF